jgi:metal-dependent amidase/aminoacylase/carboxypeptidase family protein
MVHNPGYDFNDQIIDVGASFWVALAQNILKVDQSQGAHPH